MLCYVKNHYRYEALLLNEFRDLCCEIFYNCTYKFQSLSLNIKLIYKIIKKSKAT